MKRVSNHLIPPLINNASKILILGSFPSVKSMEKGFYYMHSQNRFYQVLDAIFDENMYQGSIELKKETLLQLRIALYDSIESCSLSGSSDASIKDVVPAAIKKLIKDSSIKHIFLNGKKSYDIFIKYHSELKDIATYLPSTSAANARYSLKMLVDEWKVIKDYL